MRPQPLIVCGVEPAAPAVAGSELLAISLGLLGIYLVVVGLAATLAGVVGLALHFALEPGPPDFADLLTLGSGARSLAAGSVQVVGGLVLWRMADRIAGQAGRTRG